MRTIGCTAANDFYLDKSNNIAILTNLAAIEQNCVSALLSLRGNMIYAQDQGIDYQKIVWDLYQPKLFEAQARARLKGVTGVTSVTSFEQLLYQNTLYFQATIKTPYGPGTVTNGGF